jgi:nucleotide-binding universal stress UspA family protein
MKILVGYDGSDYGNAIFVDLLLAGLPPQLECVVLSVAERWLPPPSEASAIAALPPEDAAEMWPVAHQGAERIRAMFPGWAVSAEVDAGSPARCILLRAQEWGAHLIIVGSLGRSVWERLWIGSVSHKLASAATCSVRVARPCEADAPRLLLAYDGLAGAERALAEIERRRWPASTEVVLHTSVGFAESPASQATLERDCERAAAMQARAEARLQAAGLTVVRSVREDDPRRALVEDARQCRATSIFMGSNQEPALVRLLLGTVSEAVLTRAPCSVEVVR